MERQLSFLAKGPMQMSVLNIYLDDGDASMIIRPLHKGFVMRCASHPIMECAYETLLEEGVLGKKLGYIDNQKVFQTVYYDTSGIFYIGLKHDITAESDLWDISLVLDDPHLHFLMQSWERDKRGSFLFVSVDHDVDILTKILPEHRGFVVGCHKCPDFYGLDVDNLKGPLSNIRYLKPVELLDLKYVDESFNIKLRDKLPDFWDITLMLPYYYTGC